MTTPSEANNGELIVRPCGGALLRDFAPLRRAAAGGGDEYECVLTTGEPYEWRANHFEVLPMNEEAADISRARGDRVMPVLRMHRWYETIGAVVSDSLRFENNKLVGRIRFDDAEAGGAGFGADDRKNVDAGFARMLSVGYRILEYEVAEKMDETGAVAESVVTAKRWELYEVSLVSVPADKDALIMSARDAASRALPTDILTRDLTRREKFANIKPDGDEAGTSKTPIVQPTDRGASQMPATATDPNPNPNAGDAARLEELAKLRQAAERAEEVSGLTTRAAAHGFSAEDIKSIGEADSPRARFDELVDKRLEAREEKEAELTDALKKFGATPEKIRAAAEKEVAAENGDDPDGDGKKDPIIFAIRELRDRYDPLRAMAAVMDGNELDGAERELEDEIAKHQAEQAAKFGGKRKRRKNEEVLLRLPLEALATNLASARRAREIDTPADRIFLDRRERASNNDTVSGIAGATNAGDVLGLTQIDRIEAAFRGVLRGNNILSELPIRTMPRVNDGDIGVGSEGLTITINTGASNDAVSASHYRTASRKTQFRTISAKTTTSRKANRNTEPSVAQLLFDDFTMALGTQLSRYALFGSAAAGEPRGLAVNLAGTNSIAVANRGEITHKNYVDAYIACVRNAKGFGGGPGYCNVVSPSALAYGLTNPKVANADSIMIISGDLRGGAMAAGMPVKLWTDFPENDANAAAGSPERANTARSNAVAGNWMELFQFLYSPVVEVRRDNDQDAGGETLRFFIDIDPAVYRTPEAFSIFTT